MNWQSLFQQLETEQDASRLHELVMECEGAIYERLQSTEIIGRSEHYELISAEKQLLTIKVEKLGFPPLEPD